MSFIGSQVQRSRGFAGAAEVGDEAITIRPSSTALFGVDSFDRYPNPAQSAFATTPYSFSITKQQNTFTGFFKRIALTEVVFPYYIPNVNPRTNSMLIIYNGGVEVPLTIPTGFYTPTALATALQAALIPLTNPGATCTYISPGRFSFDVGAGNDLILFSSTGNDGYDLFDLIGGTDVWFGAAQQVQTGKITRCRYTEYIDIVCSQLTYNQNLKDATTTNGISRDVLARIYLETENDQPVPVLVGATQTNTLNTIPGTYPFTIYRQFATPKYIKWEDSQPIGNLTFEVYDDRGVLLSGNDTGNNGDFIFPDWRMTLLISEN